MEQQNGDWTCPRCGQNFVVRNASHSCITRSAGDFFEGKPRPETLFKAILKIIEEFGPVEVAATKTQISFRARTRFAWVWMPQTWIKKASPDMVVLTFDLPHPVRSPKIKEVVNPRPGRWTHHIEVYDETALDEEVEAWLREAYEFGAVNPRVRKRNVEPTQDSAL